MPLAKIIGKQKSYVNVFKCLMIKMLNFIAWMILVANRVNKHLNKTTNI